MAKPSQPALSEIFSLPWMWLFQIKFFCVITSPTSIWLFIFFGHTASSGQHFCFVNSVDGLTIVLYCWLQKVWSWSFFTFPTFPEFCRFICLLICWPLNAGIWTGLSFWLRSHSTSNLHNSFLLLILKPLLISRLPVSKCWWCIFNVAWKTVIRKQKNHQDISSLHIL